MQNQETLLAEVRALLYRAAVAERSREIEAADALGARASNKLARVVFMSSKVVPLDIQK